MIIYFKKKVTTMITVGYGDIIPHTPNEKLFTILSMMVACCVFAYIMNGIGLIVISLNKRKALLRYFRYLNRKI